MWHIKIFPCYTTITVGEDYVGVPLNLTFTQSEETTQFVNVTIFDDDLVERLEVIQLNLSALIPESDVHVTTNTAEIMITDDDCEYKLWLINPFLTLIILCYSSC